MSTYKPTIGIEVHAELTTKSKMFCDCKNDPHASSPNTHICPVCMAHPGTLPQVNKAAVEKILQVGIALEGALATYSEFDRKHYFYPDIPKAYQLSQYAFPFVQGGTLHGVAITRVHLEEDTARSSHEHEEGSVVDFNRAGVPLMELVTEPVIHDSATASAFARELQLLLKRLGVSNANMEKGEMRVEANVSVSANEKLGVKVEVKNLNSFKALESAIEYEINRQSSLLDAGETVVQETRGWDESRQRTFSQRVKETAEDYRYFPDPDIPKYDISLVTEFSRLAEKMPILPNKIRENFLTLGIPRNQIEIVLSDEEALEFLDRVIAKTNADPVLIKRAVNYLVTDLFALVNSSALCFRDAKEEPFCSLLSMLEEGTINSRVAKDLLKDVVFGGNDPMSLAKERNLLQVSSSDSLLEVVDAVIAENPKVVTEYRGGKTSVLQFMVGQGMKATKGSANPAALADLFRSRLD